LKRNGKTQEAVPNEDVDMHDPSAEDRAGRKKQDLPEGKESPVPKGKGRHLKPFCQRTPRERERRNLVQGFDG